MDEDWPGWKEQASQSAGHQTTGASTIVPTRAIQLIERALNDKDETVDVAARNNDLMVRTPQAVIYSRLVEGRYPNWRQVFPKSRECSPTGCYCRATCLPLYVRQRL